MSNGKGKGRATGVNNKEPEFARIEPPNPTSNSAISRVFSSARGLANSAFSAPGSHEVNDNLSAALSSSGKGQQSGSAGTSAWAESSKATNLTSDASFGANPPPQFRTHQQQHVAGAEAEFSAFLDDIPVFEPSIESNDHGLGSEASGSTGNQAAESVEHKVWSHRAQTVHEQEARDGLEVANLLSDPSLNLAEQEEVYNPPTKVEPVVWKMTELQRTEWNERLRADFPDMQHREAPAIEAPLNLIPVQDTLTEEERQHWLDQWEGVLTRYTDEVWGDLLPLVKEARAEVETIKESEESALKEQPKAIRRLGLILGHLRQQ